MTHDPEKPTVFRSTSISTATMDWSDGGAASGIPSDELLCALLHAYELGTSRTTLKESQGEGIGRVQQAWLADPSIFGLGDASSEQRTVFAKGKYCCNQARKLAIRGEALAAWQQVALAERHFTIFRHGSELQLLARSEVLSAEAAVEYQEHNYAASHERLDAARDTDRRLVGEFGKAGALAHGFHLISKRIQLEAAQHNFSYALRIAAASLVILCGGEPRRPIDLWPLAHQDRRRLPAGLCRFLCRQLTIEIGATMLLVPTESVYSALGDFVSEMSGQRGTIDLDTLDCDAMDRDWLRAKLISVQPAATAAHLEACIVLLQNRRQGADVLWLMCALDAANRCLAWESPLASEFCRRTFSDLCKQEDFPTSLRNRWSRLCVSIHP